MDDQMIIELFNKRSHEAITAVSDKYGSLCKSISKRILQNTQDAEECVNDAYLVLWNTIPPENPNPFAAYICRIVKNITLKKYRYNTAEKRNSHYDLSMEELKECIEDRNTPENSMEEKELTRVINCFLEKCKKTDRVKFVKRYCVVEDPSEIAKEMGLSNNYVNVHLHRTREKLKQFLMKERYYEF